MDDYKIQKYIINEEIKIHNNDNPFMNTKIESLFLYESLDIIPKDFFLALRLVWSNVTVSMLNI